MNWSELWSRRFELALRAALLVGVAVVFLPVSSLFTTAFDSIALFRQVGGNYQAMRSLDRDMWTAMEASRYIPQDARWVADPVQELTKLKFRYFMYPNTNRDWKFDFLIDVYRERKEMAPHWKRVELANGAYIYICSDRKLLDPPLPPLDYSPWKPVLGFVVVTGFSFLLGLVSLTALSVKPRSGGMFWYLSSAYLLGVALTSFLAWAYLYLGGSLTPPQLLVLWLLPLIVIVLLGRRRIKQTFREMAVAEPWRIGFPAVGIGWLPVAFALLLLLALLAPIVLSPVYSFDSLSHWMYKARALAHHQTLSFSESSHHNEYPLLWPLHVAGQYAFGGGAHDESAKWTIALMLVAFTGQLIGAMTFLRVHAAAAWGLVALFILLFNDPSLSWTYAETPFVAFLGAAIVMVGMAWQADWHRGQLALAWIFVAAVVGTKLEGTPAAIIFALALAVAQPRFPFAVSGWLLLALFSSTIAIEALWYAYQSAHGYLENVSHLREPLTLAKIQAVINQVVFSDTTHAKGWLLAMGIAMAAVLQSRRCWSPYEVFLGMLALGLILFVPIGLLGWPMKHLPTSLSATPRLILHATPPLIILLGALLWRDAADRNPLTNPDHSGASHSSSAS